VNVGAPGITAQPHTALRPNTTAGANLGTGANIASGAHVGAAGANLSANAGARAAATAAIPRTSWHTLNSTQLQGVRTNLSSALQAQTAARATANLNAANAATANAGANLSNRTVNNYFLSNPNRAAYLSSRGTALRNNFSYGGSPFFNNGFWMGRNLIGLGLGGYGLGGYGGYGLGGYGLGGYGLGGYGGYGLGGYGGLGNWWGYSPWLGTQPWNYWYGNTGWGTFANNYGWNQPYYYDYGPNGNVAYQGSQVLVNNQPVGTPAEYAQSAADLAAITPEQMNAPHEWMPLGTFSVATHQDETNPPRVAQLAYDNKQGLISGTIFNRNSGNLYTIQGKVDPQTQRTAFTIGNDPNTVMETGLFNLTQQETPVLVHFGPDKTATYLFARVPEPPTDQQPTATAAAPQPAAVTPPADDLRR